MHRLVFFLTIFFFFPSTVLGESTEAVFSTYSNRVVQVQVVEKVSKVKASIGSGFYVSDDGLLVTNYHVISSVVFDPDKYQITLLYRDNTKKEAKLLYLDVVRDLALLKISEIQKSFLISITQHLVLERKYTLLVIRKILGLQSSKEITMDQFENLVLKSLIFQVHLTQE